MTLARRRSLVRKLVYAALIVPLLLLLWWLGNPATKGARGQQGSPGGKLARLRTDKKLDQAQLGQLDPTSAAVKLATLGMRGIAANILWTKANNYKMKKDWTNLSATLNQLTKVQPNFVEVWRHQSWNLAYNCSVEFDDYRERYRWVIKGIRFLQTGIDYNPYEPKLYQYMGWIISQKIGRADEHVQFRRLFIADDDFHGARRKIDRDNWLVGKQWYRQAESVVDTYDIPLGGASPQIFRSQAPMCQMNYGEALEKDGVFGERAKRAWQQASKDWDDFGKLDIPASDGRVLRLGELDRCQARIAQLGAELDALAPGARKALEEQKASLLTPEHKAAMSVPPQDRTPEQHELAAQAEALQKVTFDEIARHELAEAHQGEANRVLLRIKEEEETLRLTGVYRSTVNYEYWERRAHVEQRDDLIAARRLIHEGDRALSQGDLPGAAAYYRQGAEGWRAVLEVFPNLFPDRATAEDIEHILDQYSDTLNQQDELFPPDFALAGFIQFLVNDHTRAYELRHGQRKVAEAFAKKNWESLRRESHDLMLTWSQIIYDIPSISLMSDRRTGAEVLDAIAKYVLAMKELKQPLPDELPLGRFVWIQLDHDPQTRAARQAIERAADAPTAEARKLYEEGFALWRKALDTYPTAVTDRSVREEILLAVDAYRQLLGELKETMPKDFILQDVLDRQKK